MIILGIESSCDDTGVALISSAGEVLAERVATQSELHSAYGGVVPEIASRAHLEVADALVREVLNEAGVAASEVDVFAAGAGPGLIGGVIVGLNLAKAMAFALAKPFVAVNHLEAHALMPMMFEPGVEFPFLMLLVSGGHTQLVLVRGVGMYELLGSTLDDAAGECFDKVAKLLGHGYMGGKEVERMASSGDARAYDFPRPMLGRGGLDFSFSGLKTAVRAEVEKSPDFIAADIAASFQAAAADVFRAKVSEALSGAAEGAKCVVAAGGVAANKAVCAAISEASGERHFYVAPMKYCTDNGVMIAWAGLLRYRIFGASPFDVAPRPRWPLTEVK